MITRADLQQDLTDAIRGRDEVRAATLRMALTSLSTEAVAGDQARELTAEEVLDVLGREAKRRREAAEAFQDAGRSDLAARERAEEAVLAEYLPSALTAEELDAILGEAVAQVAADGVGGTQVMGAVMRLVQPRVKGRADGRAVAEAVRQRIRAEAP